jgi:trans-AT polyketide synthase/acyltransferase/oxidoreductase domain-containing protein
MTRVSHACLFPGQGSQSKGMGAALFDRYQDWTAAANRILGYSIRELCVDDPRGELGLTQFTQPALFVVNAMTYRARLDDGAAPPAYVAGHSLGEYNALLAAGVFDFATGLTMVKRRGALMGQVSGGGMAAVIGMEPEKIEDVLAASDEGRRLDVANFNSFEQTVIAGPVADIAAVKPQFEAAGVRAFIPLKVSAPFHSRYMREPQAEFSAFLEGFTFGAPSVPVVANATAAPYAPDHVRETLARQIGSAVRWLDSMRFLLDAGVTEFEECGPGSVLAKLMVQIRKRAPRP